MALRITEDCIDCKACEAVCPNGAIVAGVGVFRIDPRLCTECVGFHDAPACVSVCPVDCCVEDPDHRETESELATKAVDLHPEDSTLAARVAKGAFPSRFRR